MKADSRAFIFRCVPHHTVSSLTSFPPFLFIAWVAAAPAPLPSQPVQTAGSDSVQVLENARRAQQRFERDRRRLLPRRLGAMPSPCDERVGRFCFWHGERDEAWEPQPEDERIVAGRLALIDSLDLAARILPGDEWIAGQRVRYLVEAGLTWSGVRAAQACASHRPGWCAALAGLALHHAGDFAAADSAFAASVRQMPETQRCEWTDLSVLLRGRLRRDYRRGTCAERERMGERIWWLADPLYAVPGNERRTEHYVRVVMAHLAEEAATPYGLPWGRDLTELVVRYGWAASWERELPPAFDVRPGSIVSHDPPWASFFFPNAEAVVEPSTLGDDDWDFERRRPPTSFAPPYARSFASLEHQLAVFRRDTMALVAAVANATRSTRDDRLSLVLSSRPSVFAVGAADRGATHVLLEVAPGTYVASVERLDESRRQAARARFALEVPSRTSGSPGISDLLITAPTDAAVRELEQALPLARGTSETAGGARLGVYWELYDIPPSETGITISLLLLRGAPSRMESPAEWITADRRARAPVGLEWRDAVHRGERIAARSVNVALPDLRRGWYTLVIRTAVEGHEPLVAVRRLHVE